MNKLFLVGIASLMAFPAVADTSTTNATVYDKFRTVVERTPYNKETCTTVDVPIYGTTSKKGNTDDMIIGGIIGGIIGNQVGNGSGKEAATGIGALTGAIIAGNNNKQQVIIGYRQENRCEYTTMYSEVTREVYSHSVIEFTQDGRTYRLKFVK